MGDMLSSFQICPDLSKKELQHAVNRGDARYISRLFNTLDDFSNYDFEHDLHIDVRHTPIHILKLFVDHNIQVDSLFSIAIQPPINLELASYIVSYEEISPAILTLSVENPEVFGTLLGYHPEVTVQLSPNTFQLMHKGQTYLVDTNKFSQYRSNGYFGKLLLTLIGLHPDVYVLGEENLTKYSSSEVRYDVIQQVLQMDIAELSICHALYQGCYNADLRLLDMILKVYHFSCLDKALQYALANKDVVQLLLKNGAHPTSYLTQLMCKRLPVDLDVLDVLLDHGVELDPVCYQYLSKLKK